MSGQPCSGDRRGRPARQVADQPASGAYRRPSRRSDLRPGLSQGRQAGSQPAAARRPWQDRHAGGGVVASAHRGRRRRPNRDRCSSARAPRDRPARSVHTEVLGVRGTQPDRTGKVVSYYRRGSPTSAVIDTTPLMQLEGQDVVGRSGRRGTTEATVRALPIRRSGDGPLLCPSCRAASL
jgi:hypothetical protein